MRYNVVLYIQYNKKKNTVPHLESIVIHYAKCSFQKMLNQNELD